MSTASQRFVSLKSTHDASVASLQQSEDLLQSLVTGLSSASATDSSSSGYMGQLATARAKLASIGSEAEQARLRVEHLQRELKEKEPRAGKAEGEGRDLISELERTKEARAKLETVLTNLGWDEQNEGDLRAAKETAAAQVRELVEKKFAVKGRLAGLDFHYSDPTKGFDRSKVKGLVATLVEINPANYRNATALEVCAGGRLFNVSAIFCSRYQRRIGEGSEMCYNTGRCRGRSCWFTAIRSGETSETRHNDPTQQDSGFPRQRRSV
jgi:structural maintenance of chromosome 2